MLTRTEIDLARAVGKYNLSKDTAVGIFAFLEKEDQQLEMLEFLKNNPDATEQDILKALKKIISR